MKRIHSLLAVGVAVSLLVSCKSGDNKGQTMTESSFDKSNLDTTANPKQDFYQYACGGWIKAHPLTEEYSRYGSFDKLAEDNQKQIHELIEQLSKEKQESGSVGQKIGELYKIGMDSAKLEKDGIEPLKQDLKAIAGLQDKKQIIAHVALLNKEGVFPFFSNYIAADEKNSDTNICNLFQGGLGLGEREYYLGTKTPMPEIREKYVLHIEKMFVLAGFTPEQAKKDAKTVMAFETALAKISLPKEALRDPEANYHKMSIESLQKLTPSFDWNLYFSSLGLKDVKDLNVAQDKFIKDMGLLFAKENVENIKAYLTWNLINTAANYLNYAMLQQNFDFYGKVLSGKEQMKPRWKQVVHVVDGSLGEAVGEMYVAKYFPAESKQRMLDLVNNLKEALQNRIKGLTWMSDTTKQKALEKLSTFRVKIGYPDKWRDYSKLEIKNDSYWANVKRSNKFEYDYMLAKAGKPVDKDEWLMTPQMVNAYYNPTTNEICFPAGILQPPFFFPKGDDALNYGAIGVVIGHEMTHGFDDQGRMYDKTGNLNDWWLKEDAQKFENKAAGLVAYFDNIIVLDSTHANGKYTLGENIADQGGILLSYAAFQKALKQNPVKEMDGFTPEQRFFLAYANVWAGNIRDQEILRLTNMDVHSLGRWRVNGTLPHIKEFLDAFGIKEGDAMYLPEDKRCVVW